MYYVDLFYRRRKTEPKFIHVVRACIMILLLAFLVAYISFLIEEIINSVPAIQISVEEINEVPFAGIDEICNDFLSQPQQLSDPHPGYIGYFINKNNLKFIKDPKDDQIIKIKLYSNTSNELIMMYIVDSENNPLKSQDNQIYTQSFQFYDFMKELFANNMYFIANNQLTYLGLARNQKKEFDPKYSGILGVNPSYKTLPHILSKSQSTPLPIEPSTEYYSEIDLTVTSFLMQVETEQRTRTLLSVLGLMGGAWGLASALYAILFGVDSIRPWGCIQSFYSKTRHRTYNKFKKTIPVLPLINSHSSMKEFDSSSPDVKKLHDRLLSLEIFLKEYVVDVKFLEKSDQMEQNKWSDDTTLNLN
ncbi:1734_t:CDS:2 [Funneliformis geosporum]|uniref:1734_t:CDS:1 n=1 Tax=Funneliformis geosporum TaxID=1117311 RepID=A0A9W4SL23_9GLOM|nr:1734_t:CDS:2 [Funneliformis geosporum]